MWDLSGYPETYGLFFSTDCTIIYTYFRHTGWSYTAIFGFDLTERNYDFYTATTFALTNYNSNWGDMTTIPQESQVADYTNIFFNRHQPDILNYQSSAF